MCTQCINSVFQSIVYLLVIILLIFLIIFAIKSLKTLKKVDKVIDDACVKSKKLDGVFDIIDHTTDKITSISDKAIDIIFNGICKLFSKNKKKEEDKDE
jgi:uncharacterized protein YoxC